MVFGSKFSWVIAEWESQGKKIKDATWKNQGVAGPAKGGVVAPKVLVPIGTANRATSAVDILYHILC